MKSNIGKIKDIFKSHSLRAIYRWSKPVHGAIAAISLMSVMASLVSLGITLVTKSLVDGAMGSDSSALWKYGILLVALMAFNRGMAILSSTLRIRTSAKLQKHMQGMVTEAILGKNMRLSKVTTAGSWLTAYFRMYRWLRAV